MAVGTLLLIIAGIVALVLTVPAVVAYANSAGRTALREARREAVNAKAREKIATKALRSIRNDSGNPALEASIALDEIEALENDQELKELN